MKDCWIIWVSISINSCFKSVYAIHGCHYMPKILNICYSFASWCCIFSFCPCLLLLIIYLFLVTLFVIVEICLVNSAAFEYEKHKNIELVDQMKAKEKNLIAMAREVEMLRAEILNAEKRINGNFLASVCCSLFMWYFYTYMFLMPPPNLFGAATPGDSSGAFLDHYGRAHGQMAVGHGQVGESTGPIGDSNGVAAGNSASGGGWAGQYDPSVARRWSLMSENQSYAAWLYSFCWHNAWWAINGFLYVNLRLVLLSVAPFLSI